MNIKWKVDLKGLALHCVFLKESLSKASGTKDAKKSIILTIVMDRITLAYSFKEKDSGISFQLPKIIVQEKKYGKIPELSNTMKWKTLWIVEMAKKLITVSLQHFQKHFWFWGNSSLCYQLHSTHRIKRKQPKASLGLQSTTRLKGNLTLSFVSLMTIYTQNQNVSSTCKFLYLWECYVPCSHLLALVERSCTMHIHHGLCYSHIRIVIWSSRSHLFSSAGHQACWAHLWWGGTRCPLHKSLQ